MSPENLGKGKDIASAADKCRGPQWIGAKLTCCLICTYSTISTGMDKAGLPHFRAQQSFRGVKCNIIKSELEGTAFLHSDFLYWLAVYSHAQNVMHSILKAGILNEIMRHQDHHIKALFLTSLGKFLVISVYQPFP